MTKKKILIFILPAMLLANYGCFYFCDGDWIENDKNYELTVESFHQYKGAICINDSLKIGLAKNSDKPYPTALYDFIQENDLLILKSNNDTVFIRRGDKTYWFKKYGITGGKNK